jgi:hypothetical protein
MDVNRRFAAPICPTMQTDRVGRPVPQALLVGLDRAPLVILYTAGE